MMKAVWTDERITALTTMWAKGDSASVIAEALGGVSRSAVIGKIHRLGLPGRTKVNQSKEQRRRSRAPQPAPRDARPRVRGGASPAVAMVEAAPRAAPALSLVEPIAVGCASLATVTASQCRWPIGGIPPDGDAALCGHPAGGFVYCEAHAKVAYRGNSHLKSRKRYQ